jgi:hypothetical protein
MQSLNSYKVLADSGSLDFIKGESPAEPLLQVVLEGRASDNRPQGLQGPRRNLGSLGNAGLAPSFLARGLIEPGLDVSVPVLVEVPIGHHLVPFGRHV